MVITGNYYIAAIRNVDCVKQRKRHCTIYLYDILEWLMNRIKTLETSLVLTTGFLVIYYFTKTNLFLYFALFFGISGIFVKPVANYIAIVWFKLADILNYFVSKIILGALFFIVLFPVSVLYRISNKNKLNLRNPAKTMWINRHHNYSSADLKNIW